MLTVIKGLQQLPLVYSEQDFVGMERPIRSDGFNIHMAFWCEEAVPPART